MAQPADGAPIQLSLVDLLLHASTPVRVTLVLLLGAIGAVWLVGILKWRQIARMEALFQAFVNKASVARNWEELVRTTLQAQDIAASRLIRALGQHGWDVGPERLRAIANRSVFAERLKARSWMNVLSSVGATGPFVGLFGTVYGIMDAFVRIGAAKGATLPVVAPAIGEALVTTAIGLAAAIPAVLIYNVIDRQIQEYVGRLDAYAAEWVAIRTDHVFRQSGKTLPLGEE